MLKKWSLTTGIHIESQPQELCNSLLRRLSHNIPASVITDDAASQLYPLVCYAPKYIREASYELLFGYINGIKERIEIEAAIASSETDQIRGLPEELLSIIFDTDTSTLFSSTRQPEGEELHADRRRRRKLEGNLMSWSLLFQFFVDTVFL